MNLLKASHTKEKLNDDASELKIPIIWLIPLMEWPSPKGQSSSSTIKLINVTFKI
ncbi:MAG: hypothetical protein ACFFCS_19725 [Candidatus Hodarchaeota archaeon]